MGSHGSPWVPIGFHGSHGSPWVPWNPMGTHGDPWGSHGSPWVPMGSPWVPMGPHGSHGTPWGPHGVPMASMENPRMPKIMDFNETHYSVRQNVGSTGSISIRNMFPLHSVTSKRPESPYGAKQKNCRKSSFSVFRPIGPLLDPYWTPIGPLCCACGRVHMLVALLRCGCPKANGRPVWMHVRGNGN